MSDFAMKYSMKKHMAKGGMMEDCMHGSKSCPECHGGMMAGGGEVKPDDDELVMRIMKKRYAMGGEVDKPIVDEMPAEYNEMAIEPAEEFSETGANSGDEDGDEAHDKDDEETIAGIMKSRKKKDKMPRPA